MGKAVQPGLLKTPGGLRFGPDAADYSAMTRADGESRRTVTDIGPVLPREPEATRPELRSSRLFDVRRRLLDGSLEADPIRIAQALLRCGVIR
ncbi:MAG: hypothetical protein ACRD00_04320 [Thermoanaerobaculia bacterium]